jgi:hypothetical protein
MDERRKPGSKPWVTVDQYNYLDGLEDLYRSAMANKTSGEFWVGLMNYWEDTWGVPIVPAELVEIDPKKGPLSDKEMLLKVRISILTKADD